MLFVRTFLSTSAVEQYRSERQSSIGRPSRLRASWPCRKLVIVYSCGDGYGWINIGVRTACTTCRMAAIVAWA